MSDGETIDAGDARELVGRREVLVIDIRTEDEFAAVRINGSTRVDPDDVESAIAEAGATHGSGRPAASVRPVPDLDSESNAIARAPCATARHTTAGIFSIATRETTTST